MYLWLCLLFGVRDAAFASSYLITCDYFVYRPHSYTLDIILNNAYLLTKKVPYVTGLLIRKHAAMLPSHARTEDMATLMLTIAGDM